MLRNPRGGPQLAFQQTEGIQPSTWPDPSVPQMFHLDTVVATKAELETQEELQALDLGATLRLDRSDDPEEPLYVFADPAGHPFSSSSAEQSAERTESQATERVTSMLPRVALE